MEKIILTPEFCQPFSVFYQAAAFSVSKNQIQFNKSAIKVLALKKEDQFILEAEGSKLSLKLATSGFKVTSILKNTYAAASSGLFEYLHKHLNQTIGDIKTFRFEIGEMHEGGYYSLKMAGFVKRAMIKSDKK